MGTIADQARARHAAAYRGLNIVTLDIERLPGRARLNHRGLTIEGDFWDLGSWKHTIGRRIPADCIIERPRTICVAWRWYGQKRVEFASEWGEGGNEQMHRTIWDVYDRADIVVGHNIKRFDSKHLKTGWAELGLPNPKPWKTVDTLAVARAEFGAESNTLDDLCKRFGIAAKTDKYDVNVAKAAVAGDTKAQRRIERYNKGDISASEGLYDYLRPRMTSHPHVGTFTNMMRCNACGSDNLQPNGTTRAVVLDYPLYRCGDCGANVKGGHHAGRNANTRGAA